MPNLKEVRIRIKSVISTQQITSAMKLVSASKFKRAQDSIVSMRPYANKLAEIMQHVTHDLEKSEDDIYAAERATQHVLLVVITSNKGLCGAFNSNVIKKTNQLIKEDFADVHKKGNLHLICVGRKGADFFSKRGHNIILTQNKILDKPHFDDAAEIANLMMSEFTNIKYDKVIIIYNMFKNAAVQILSTHQFLPVAHDHDEKKEKKGKTYKAIDYIFEPDKKTILKELIPKMLKVQFFKMLLESIAAEHGARMTAMHKATDNASELLKELRLSYNKARQAQITKEIVEIVSGANALEN